MKREARNDGDMDGIKLLREGCFCHLGLDKRATSWVERETWSGPVSGIEEATEGENDDDDDDDKYLIGGIATKEKRDGPVLAMTVDRIISMNVRISDVLSRF